MKGGEEGSILFEALIASAIVAMILGATYQIVADSAARHQKVEARRYALMVARSELASVGSAPPLTSGSQEGTAGQDVWRIDMQPCATRRSAAGVLYCVTVSVRDAAGGPPLVTLSTRRLAPSA